VEKTEKNNGKYNQNLCPSKGNVSVDYFIDIFKKTECIFSYPKTYSVKQFFWGGGMITGC